MLNNQTEKQTRNRKEQGVERKKTCYRDKSNHPIHTGDILFVEEHPEKYVGGSYSYEGVVEEEDGRIVVRYMDIGEDEAISLSYFPKAGREILDRRGRYRYWKTQLLGGEPPKDLWDWCNPWEDINQPLGNKPRESTLNRTDFYMEDDNDRTI